MLSIKVFMVRSSPGVKSGENPFAFLNFDPAETIRAEQHEGKTRAKQTPSSHSFPNLIQGRNTQIFTRKESSVARPAKAAAKQGAARQATLPAPHTAYWDQSQHLRAMLRLWVNPSLSKQINKQTEKKPQRKGFGLPQMNVNIFL